MKTKIFVLSSTHWDREWYQTFQQFRFRLVRNVDNLIESLEKDPANRCFHFDGQTIVIEDYLEIRPENRERLYKLIREGRILIGPWYTMPDEFLIGGEGLIRNLQRGAAMCKELGVESADNGYVCDIFGHNSQMPQIFRQFGQDTTAFFRGRSGYEKDAFVWQGADGSELLVHKLHPDYAYSDFFFIVRWPFGAGAIDYDKAEARMREYLEQNKANFAAGQHLMIDGVDHIDADERIVEILAELNKRFDDYEFIHSDFKDLNEGLRKCADKLEKFSGCFYELGNEGMNNSVLKNVLSSMVHLKQANDASETGLSLICEPLDAFLTAADFKDDAFYHSCSPAKGYLDLAWNYVLKNQPHDSICGCSISETHEDNVNRFKQVAEIMQLLKTDLMAKLGRNVQYNGKGKYAVAVFNPSQAERKSTLHITVKIPSGNAHNLRFYGDSGEELKYTVTDTKTVLDHKADFKGLIEFPAFDHVSVVLGLPEGFTLPAYSYAVFGYDILTNEFDRANHVWPFKKYYAPQRNLSTMRTAENTFDNGVYSLKVNADGSLDVTEKASGKTHAGVHFFEDCGDAGDGWNYMKPYTDEQYFSQGEPASFAVITDTSDYAKLKLVKTLRLPENGDWLRRGIKRVEMEIITFVELYKNDSLIRFTTSTLNTATNHRLRVGFPTGVDYKQIKTLLPFDLYAFNNDFTGAETAKETETFVFPNQGAVSVREKGASFTLFNKGLYEVGVSRYGDGKIYLTLLRSFTNQSGTFEPCVMGQMKRELKFEYAVDFTPRGDADTVKDCYAYKTGLLYAPLPLGDGKALGGATKPAKDTFLKVTGEAVVSSVQAEKGIVVLRMSDYGAGCLGEIALSKKIVRAEYVDLLGNVVEKGELKSGKLNYKLGSKQIKTVKLYL